MRASAVSFTHKFIAAALAALLTLTLAPLAYADGEASNEGNPGVVASALADHSNDSADPSVILSEGTEGPGVEESSERPLTLASGLAGRPSSFINSDVSLDSEPIIGSFTVDGLTYAVIDGPYVELVGVSPSVILSEGSEAAGAEESNSNHASEAGVTNLALPETVSYEGVSHIVSLIGAYAFYLSGVTDVTLPASVNDVDDRAFRSSDVVSVEVAEDNPAYSSFDGALYDVEQLSLLLIPEGKQGAVLLPKTAEVAEASVFSHCPLVDSISVEKDGAAFASENGLLYTSDLTTLLRVPAGATEITIREGCTTIAAGALEACAKLATINAPSTVTSISSDVFHAIPTVSLPATALVEEAPQLTAMVALSSNDDDLPEVTPSTIEVMQPEKANKTCWQDAGFSIQPVFSEDAAMPRAVLDESIFVTPAGLISFHSFRASDHLYYWESGSNIHTQQIFGTTGFATRVAGWYKIYHAANDGRYGIFKVIYSPSRGWHVCRLPNSLSPYMDLYPETPATSVSRTPTGPDLPVDTLLYDKENVFFRYGPVIGWHGNGGTVEDGQSLYYVSYSEGASATGLQPSRPGYVFLGWYTDPVGGERVCGANEQTAPLDTHDDYYAHWGYGLSFDTSSEPGDEDYEGEPKDDQTMNVEDGLTVIEDPKRPGYVFQGWTIPNAGGTEAIDQDLVYQGDDGKWYVDASKLPDYAGDDGRVELTARWTSVISVDVPSSVTFYADVVTQGNESREGLASSAFGQSKVASQSEVDLRIVGLESKQVKGNGSTSLGASDLLKKADGSAVSGTDDKLFSLYPATGELEEDDLKDPDATSASKPAGAVDFSLDDILLEKSFAADEFTIPAGGTLSLGYRLNLQETSTELDYDKLSTLSEGASASIANISYCFTTDVPPSAWGEPLWIENPDKSPDSAKYLLLKDIKAAAEDLSANGLSSAYYSTYKGLLDAQVTNGGNPGAGPYFQLKVDGVYLPLQLIGICQDTKTAGGKAGLTFQMRDIYAYDNVRSTAAGGGAFDCRMNASPTNSGSWNSSAMRATLRSVFWNYLPARLQTAIAPVNKFQQLCGGTTAAYLQEASSETVWLPSTYEVTGLGIDSVNESEALTANGSIPFQYMAYRGNKSEAAIPYVTKTYAGSINGNKPTTYYYWLRTAMRHVAYAREFSCAHLGVSRGIATRTYGVAPAFCL